MAASFEDRVNSPEMRYAYQLAYSMRMLAEISDRYQTAQDSDDLLPAMAMLDAFYVHIRLIAEFLTRKTNTLDFGPAQFGVEGWTVPSTHSAERLTDYWHRASKYVMHFGHDRVPANLDELQSFEVTAATLQTMTRDAVDVLDAFVAQVEASDEGSSVLTVQRLRAQLLRAELDRCKSLLEEG